MNSTYHRHEWGDEANVSWFNGDGSGWSKRLSTIWIASSFFLTRFLYCSLQSVIGPLFTWIYECDSLGCQLRRPWKSLCDKYHLANLEKCSDTFIDSHSKSTKHYGNQPVNNSAKTPTCEFYSYPPVLVPAIMSKYWYGWGLGSFSSLIISINSLIIKSEANPRIPPPSKWHLAVYGLSKATGYLTYQVKGAEGAAVLSPIPEPFQYLSSDFNVN